ncbi:MAG: tyrosine-type recombinase/integrase, partial [Bacteroidota bacterium]|nr:tyrosine-type recombinase/integrase [Bacteroidota bacterium]
EAFGFEPKGKFLKLQRLSGNPFAQIKPLRIEPKHPDYLREDELQRFFEQRISRPYKYFFLGLLDTGMRFNECATLRREDVDFEALQELRRKPYSETLVFATETGKKIPQTTALEKCKRAAREAGIERPVKVHMLRASFASHLTSRGALIQDVSRLLGHHSIQETEDAYAYLSPDRMHSQVNLICHVEININITTK